MDSPLDSPALRVMPPQLLLSGELEYNPGSSSRLTCHRSMVRGLQYRHHRGLKC